MPWSVAFMVVAIVMITAIARVARDRNKHMLSDHGTPHVQSADAMRAQDEIRQLRERVQVLERVITDGHGSADLSQQIEQLRDR